MLVEWRLKNVACSSARARYIAPLSSRKLNDVPAESWPERAEIRVYQWPSSARWSSCVSVARSLSFAIVDADPRRRENGCPRCFIPGACWLDSTKEATSIDRKSITTRSSCKRSYANTRKFVFYPVTETRFLRVRSFDEPFHASFRYTI